jgi:hypothetical protein
MKTIKKIPILLYSIKALKRYIIKVIALYQGKALKR